MRLKLVNDDLWPWALFYFGRYSIKVRKKDPVENGSCRHIAVDSVLCSSVDTVKKRISTACCFGFSIIISVDQVKS